MNLPEGYLDNVLPGALTLLIGIPLTYIISQLVSRLIKAKSNEHLSLVARKLTVYLGWLVVLIIFLGEIGLDLTAVLATAGVATIAIGFAAQTSLSNLISGIFLLVEKPFQIGDLIRVGSTTGIVYAIDLMAIKLRTFDNLYIRIPNETMIKSEVVNITRFPIRRMDIELRISYNSDLDRAMTILQEVADANTLCLDEPRPVLLIRKFGDHGVEILWGLWFEKTKFLDLRNSILKELKKRFEAEKVEIAVPHVRVHSGADGAAFALKIERDTLQESEI